MKIFYYKAPLRNFGDDLNSWLWPRVWPGLELIEQYDWLIGIGSVLDGRLGDLLGRKLVLGAGYRPSQLGPPPAENVTILAVRGRLTCEELGLDPKLAKGDPAVLIQDAWQTQGNARSGIGFMPHYQTSRAFPLRSVVEDAGLVYIDPESEVETVLKAMSGVDRLLTEAMHGAIVADALGLPWKRVGLYNHVREAPGSVDFKWADWASVYGLDWKPSHLHELPIPAKGLVRRAVRRLGRAGRLRGVAAELRRASDSSGFQVSNRTLCRERCEDYRSMLHRISGRLTVESALG